ncbi:MFS transporter [Vulcanisaeta sp. JCM 16161]|uniref:MFS transporter n=1 Tax=Vulcanisaeta sp. JCM 16161 TaxID=1295372 RepID=UPI00406CCE4D
MIVRINREIAHYAIIIFLITFATRATNNMIGTTAPLLARYDLLFPNYLVGFLVSAVTAVNLASIVFINARLPGSTRRLLFIVSNALIVALLPMYFLANSLSIWIASILTGFAYGLIMPNILTSASIVGDQFTAERILVLYTLALSTSLVVGPLFETYLLTRLGYRYVFLLFIPLAILSLALSFNVRFPPDPREVRTAVNTGRILRNKGLISALLANSTYSIPFVVFTAFIAIYAQSVYHVSRYLAYFSFVPFFLTSFLTRLYLTIYVPRSLFRPMLISIMLTMIGITLLYLSPNYVVFLASMSILGIPHGSTYPLSTLMISRGTRIEERNAANSYFAAFQGILGIIVPALFGISADMVGIRLSMALLLIPVITIAIAFVRFYLNSGLEQFRPGTPSSR